MSDPLASVNSSRYLKTVPVRAERSTWLGRKDGSPVMLLPTIVTPAIVTGTVNVATQVVAQVTGVRQPDPNATDPSNLA
ncbi:hypothetical protein AWW66_14825 [Micromonospora rosaria]|uniref:Uncharacterized protein n=1 Tax=Micromonospora rosaria TaxID=47874 RepID=A0A136PRT8_9ACTN|nr:hypothetical protein [Micromonospora rosaria]KXK61182.1 hypothetical protein AWW66_14825 [Micromonospora rosaria]